MGFGFGSFVSPNDDKRMTANNGPLPAKNRINPVQNKPERRNSCRGHGSISVGWPGSPAGFLSMSFGIGCLAVMQWNFQRCSRGVAERRQRLVEATKDLMPIKSTESKPHRPPFVPIRRPAMAASPKLRLFSDGIFAIIMVLLSRASGSPAIRSMKPSPLFEVPPVVRRVIVMPNSRAMGGFTIALKTVAAAGLACLSCSRCLRYAP